MTDRPGRTVWLASYPKSGNTWVRAIVTALGKHPQLFGVDGLSSGAQPHHVGMALSAYGIDPRWLTPDENDQVRAALAIRIGTGDADSAPILRKTHEPYRAGSPGREPFPLAATRAAILVVRDPRDVACSYAAFFGISIDEAIAAMARESGEPDPHPARAQTAQPWGTWTTHAESWLDDSVPFPVHLVRYEDLADDAGATLRPVFDAIRLDCTDAELSTAVALAEFDALRRSEEERGFRGTHHRTQRFFRRGVAGGWRDDLDGGQVATIEADHAPMMQRLGYAVSTTPAVLADSLGLSVHEGPLPEVIEGATRPRPWMQVTRDAALLRFRGGAGLLVTNGRDITVDPGPGHADEVGWMVQGWGVTLAMLQRGLLSLHASTVEVDGRVIAIAGRRRAGKSSTAMGLRARGHALLCDDVTLVEFRDGAAWTTPYWRNVHLLEDSASALGLDFDDLPPLGAGRVKGAFRAEQPDNDRRRIDRVVILSAAADADRVEISHPSGSARMAALLEHTERDGIAPVILGQERYFSLVAHLADVVPITRIARPAETWTLDDVLDAIEADT